MQLISALRRLWRHAGFRRLMMLRFLSQAGDGTLQVGMASYILFSPQSQPTAWAIAGVLAITLLPFTVIGPFVSPLLDRWSRRNVALYSDMARAALALLIGIVIATRLTTGVWTVVLFGALLIAMSINRFMLAGLSAGLQHTVDEDEYLSASSIAPTVGPLGVVIGAVLGFTVRLGLGDTIGSHGADAVVFILAALMFVGSVLVCRGFAISALGPTREEARMVGSIRARMGSVVRGLGDAARHLRTRPAAEVGLLLMAVTRLLFGLFSVAVILAARQLWHPVDQPEAALADITLWGLATGVGFLLAAPTVPTLVRLVGLRWTGVSLLAMGAFVSLCITLTTSKLAIFVASFFIGLAVQSFKICVDTLVQAHVDEGYKGRAFTFYDMLFNGAFVTSAVVAALVLPPTGFSTPAFVGIALTYVACAVTFHLVGVRLGRATMEKGTQDVKVAV